MRGFSLRYHIIRVSKDEDLRDDTYIAVKDTGFRYDMPERIITR